MAKKVCGSVGSTRVRSMSYDAAAGAVRVVFCDGTPWVYEGVPKRVFNRFAKSASKGKFINRVLNGYAHHGG